MSALALVMACSAFVAHSRRLHVVNQRIQGEGFALRTLLLRDPEAAWQTTGLLGPSHKRSRLSSPLSAESSQQTLPERPRPMDTGAGRSILAADDVTATREEVAAEAEARDADRALSDSVKALCAEATSTMQYGMFEEADTARAAAKDLLEAHEAASPHKKTDRSWMLGSAYENFVKIEALSCFLKTGAALSRSSLGEAFEDTEYIGGVISMCQELSHYALRRATVLDTVSVNLCLRFISDVKAELSGFDFRNGPLRKKFDGVKYAERRCQDLLYDLSFAEGSTASVGKLAPALDVESANDLTFVDKEEWEHLRQAYAEYDQKRELVIKACRDVQKAAKQAIFAAQRGDLNKTEKLIGSASAGAKTIWEQHVEENPGLRYGSFQGALEELAEAELFLGWLKWRNTEEDAEHSADMPVLPRRKDLACGLLSAQEYLGALSDYTGEVGRVAVEKATRREREAVQECLRSTFAAHAALASAPLVGKQLDKLDAARRNMRKIETIQYDLAVRANVKGSVPSISGDGDDGTPVEETD